MIYLELLIETFREAAEKSVPELNHDDFIELLLDEIKKIKYDVQDQTFIETSLNDDRESFIESFSELITSSMNNVDDRVKYLDSEKGKSDVITCYIKSINYTIDFCYNAIISKQFSDT